MPECTCQGFKAKAAKKKQPRKKHREPSTIDEAQAQGAAFNRRGTGFGRWH